MTLASTLLATAITLTAILTAADAVAVTRSRTPGAHATAFCQPALPAFDSLIRKRPLAVQNEGTATAFVTCSVPIDILASDLGGAALFFVNNTGGEVSIACTLANGATGNIIYIPKTTTGDDPYLVNTWTPDDIGGGELANQMSFSCALPPGTGMHFLYTSFYVDVGA